jgi:hypothetical protein
MSLGYEIVVGVLLFVGHSVSTGELPVNGFPTDADFNWRLGREGLELRPAVKTDLPGATPRMLISTIAV